MENNFLNLTWFTIEVGFKTDNSRELRIDFGTHS
jgi:hypothetical protein